jgi:predicted PurR-regulated permease PerM
MPLPHQDLTRSTLAVLFIGGLIAASVWVMQPFLPAITWAVTLVIATWPLMIEVQHFAGNRRGIAVLVMTLLLLLVLIVPFWLAISTIVTNLDEITNLAQTVLSMRVPPPPDWLATVPLVGDRAAQAWGQLTAMGAQELAPRLTPYAGAITHWFASAVGGLGAMFLQFLLVVAIAAVMYAGGERGAATAMGVVVTAVAQSVLGGIGLAVVGVPFASLLTALMFTLCLAQIGPALVLIPAVVWMYYSGDPLWATVLLAFTLVAMTMDNFLRPVLIRRGADLPLLLILFGVIGGLIAFGLLGIFLGPTVLAIAYTLLTAWMAEDDEVVPPVGHDSLSRVAGEGRQGGASGW